MDIDTFDVMVSTDSCSSSGSGVDNSSGSGVDNSSGGVDNSSGSGVDNSSGSGDNSSGGGSGDGGGLDSVKVGVFGVCTQHTPSLADPGDKVVFNDGINDGF